MCFADLEERQEALRHGKVYDIDGSPPYDEAPKRDKPQTAETFAWLEFNLGMVVGILTMTFLALIIF